MTVFYGRIPDHPGDRGDLPVLGPNGHWVGADSATAARSFAVVQVVRRENSGTEESEHLLVEFRYSPFEPGAGGRELKKWTFRRMVQWKLRHLDHLVLCGWHRTIRIRHVFRSPPYALPRKYVSWKTLFSSLRRHLSIRHWPGPIARPRSLYIPR